MAVNSFADKIVKKIFGTETDKYLKDSKSAVEHINSLEAGIKELSDEQLSAKTEEYKKRIQDAVEGTEDKDERYKEEQAVLKEIMPEAFAVVREASVRTTGMRHFDVQLVGGMVLHEGKIAEMRTGEGKTLVSTLPAYLNGLTGRGVHIVTVNEYLARRDSEWMGEVYNFLGLTVGCINDHEPWDPNRQEAYRCDITYGTNNEFGFDYLRDNMGINADDLVQRKLHYTMIDEVDSVLIDDARTPLIISGPVPKGTEEQEYHVLKPKVENLINAQRKKATEYLAEGKRLFKLGRQTR